MVKPVDFKLEDNTSLRSKVAHLIESSVFVNMILAVILINAVVLGMETDHQASQSRQSVLQVIDNACLAVFVTEILLKFFVYRFSFFRVGWNIFDFVVVAISLIPSAGSFQIVRAFRILRVLRLMSVVPQMRNVVSALLDAIPGMASIAMVLMVVFYVSAVLTTLIFGSHQAPEMQELFGSISASMYSLFQVMTLEGWADSVANPTLKYFPLALIFFIPFIVITSFAVLNLFIGIIVDALQKIYTKEALDNVSEDPTYKQILLLREEVQSLKEQINKG